MCELVEVTVIHLKPKGGTWKMVFGVLGERRDLPTADL